MSKVQIHEQPLIEEITVEASTVRKRGRPKKLGTDVEDDYVTEQILEVPSGNYRKVRKFIGKKLVEETEGPIKEGKRFIPGSVKLTRLINGEQDFEDEIDVNTIIDYIQGGRIRKAESVKRSYVMSKLNKAESRRDVVSACMELFSDYLNPNCTLKEAYRYGLSEAFGGIKPQRFPSYVQFTKWIAEDNVNITQFDLYDEEYNKLSEAEQNGRAGKALLKKMGDLEKEIIGIDTMIELQRYGLLEKTTKHAISNITKAVAEENIYGETSRDTTVSMKIAERMGGQKFQSKQTLNIGKTDFGGDSKNAEAVLDTLLG